MPITLKKDVWKVKDPSSGQYRGAAILSTTLPQDAAQIISESNDTIQNIKDTAIEAVDTALNDESTGLIPKAEADRDAIDDSLNNETNGIIPTAQSDRDDIDDSLNNIEDGIIPTAQANLATIAAAVQSQIGQGTDKTLSVAKGFADAKAAGMLVKVSDYQPGSALDDPATSQDASQNTGYPVYKDSNRVWVKETYAELEVPTMDDVNELKSALGTVVIFEDVETQVDLQIVKGFWLKDYYDNSKIFTSDNARRSAMLSVEEGQRFKVTTTVSPSSISGVIFFDSTDKFVDEYLPGPGTPTTYTNYEYVVPPNATQMAVQSSTTTNPALTSVENKPIPVINPNNFAEYVQTKKIYLGNAENIVKTTLGTNWTESDGVYTHASGSTSPLQLQYAFDYGEIYWLSFDVSYTSGECVKVIIGTGPKAECYNGTNHVELALAASGMTLYFEPFDSVSFSLSNILIKKVQEDGEEKEVTINSVLVGAHSNNFGFWNALLTPDSASTAPNTTRSIAIGNNSLYTLKSGNRNIGIGTFAFASLVEGKENVAIGSDSAYQVKNGEGNVYIGMGAGAYGTTNNDNVAIGRYAMQTSENASRNILRCVAIGGNSGIHTYGSDNVYIGYQAGYRNRGGKNLVVIGSNSLGCDGGDANTFVGAEIIASAGIANSIGLGHAAIPTKSNQMILGSTEVTEVVFCGNKKMIFNQDGTVTWEAII